MKETIWWGFCSGIWKHLKDKSSVRGRLTFIDFLHHLVGIKINCSHFMKTLSCSGCPWLPFPDNEKSIGGASSHHPFHNRTRLHWDHQCHPRQRVAVPGVHCIQRHVKVNPLKLRSRGPLGRADLRKHYCCVIELWVYAGPRSQAGPLVMGSRVQWSPRGNSCTLFRMAHVVVGVLGWISRGLSMIPPSLSWPGWSYSSEVVLSN